ncbi:hypothetical protein O181_061388 [Austropuccinia psidii MF-1]|uniref:Uncharacterized protein n=1 Tax=Austropuccinia psidii MF-1 TaxID=1389203 RepID=A0A9Q3EHZ6_9BASI|nr:hypothetical protein [Austropuccinia psidii MF-1]
MMKVSPSVNGPQNPKQDNGNDSGQSALSPQALICPPPLLGHHPMVTSLLDQRKVIIQPKKDGNGKRKFKLGPIITMSCHPWDPNAKIKPSQHNEPPIPGPSPSSKPPEDVPTCEPEPEVAPTQSMKEPFEPNCLLPPVPSYSHSYDDTRQQFTSLRPTLMIPPAINQILLGHHCFLHKIPFVDATHQNEMHWEFREELNSLLSQALEGYSKEDITRIVSKYLEK